MSIDTHKCGFCGGIFTTEYLNKNKKSIIISPVDQDSKICSDCISKCHNAVECVAESNIKEDNLNIKDTKPSSIFKDLSQWIIGQDKAKKDISTGVYNHLKMIKSKALNLDIDIEKSNILLAGPTGTGKTAIVKALGKKLDLPYVIVDANSFTQAG